LGVAIEFLAIEFIIIWLNCKTDDEQSFLGVHKLLSSLHTIVNDPPPIRLTTSLPTTLTNPDRSYSRTTGLSARTLRLTAEKFGFAISKICNVGISSPPLRTSFQFIISL
jgi:hypothetical protein